MDGDWLQTLLGPGGSGEKLVFALLILLVSASWAGKAVSMLVGLRHHGGCLLTRLEWELVVGAFAFFLLMAFLFGWDLVLDPSMSPQRWLETNGLLVAALLGVYGLSVVLTASVLLVDGVRRLRKRPGQTGSL